MYMKKLMLIFTLLVITNVFSQTEEETIYWLKNFGSALTLKTQYHDLTNLDSNNNPCGLKGIETVIINSYGIKILRDERFCGLDYYKRSYELNFNNLNEVYFEEQPLITDCKTFYKLKINSENKAIISFYEERSITKGKVVDSQSYLDTVIEIKFKTKEDAERFGKALMHLAKLKGAKPKPKVNKNTF